MLLLITYLPNINDIYHADFKIKESTPYNLDSGSDSGDQFKPTEHPESEDEDNLEGNVEVESEHDTSKNEAKSTKVKSKKSKSKIGHKDIIATRKIHATAGTPSIIKLAAHESKGSAR